MLVILQRNNFDARFRVFFRGFNNTVQARPSSKLLFLFGIFFQPLVQLILNFFEKSALTQKIFQKSAPICKNFLRSVRAANLVHQKCIKLKVIQDFFKNTSFGNIFLEVPKF